MKQSDRVSLSNEPQRVTPTLWYYEEEGGLMIVHEIHDARHVRTILRTRSTFHNCKPECRR